MLEPVRWISAGADLLPGRLRLIDQTRLPGAFVTVDLDGRDAVVDAIRRLVVRGAPAIGCAAAFGLAAVCQHSVAASAAAFLAEAEEHASVIGAARPTAVNLTWALKRCLHRLRTACAVPVPALKRMLVQEAQGILDEDLALCRAIGEHGLGLFGGRSGVGVLTHCNAGALATSGLGTALAPLYLAQERGLAPRVLADETRPLLQGARLTAWELGRAGIAVTVICDNMAAACMRAGLVDLVLVGADRIAANGDTANKIGTYAVAVLARHHGIPFHVAAPYSTVDPSLAHGGLIPIEERDGDEVRLFRGRRAAPAGCGVRNPAFDVTPAELITGIVTERGILAPPYGQSLQSLGGR